MKNRNLYQQANLASIFEIFIKMQDKKQNATESKKADIITKHIFISHTHLAQHQ